MIAATLDREQARTPEAEPRLFAGRRLGRFLVVGLSSLAVGIVSVNVIYWCTHTYILAVTVSFLLSCLNSFVWNRQWTFSDRRGRPAIEQALKYFVVNTVGYAISITIQVTVLALLTRPPHEVTAAFLLHAASAIITRRSDFSFWQLNGSGCVATVCVVAWNYALNRAWSFRH
jgi:putative flippase GtrA